MNREQLKTILWLRWCLMRNQWSRSGGLGAVIAILVGAGAVMLGFVCFAGALLGAAFGLSTVPSKVIMFIWLGVTCAFLFFWMVGLLAELQRSETIDLQRLMHLPVALGQMFVINYIVSHFTLSLIVTVPIMMGLGIGLIFARGPEMALVIPLALSMVFMITAWTYCLRGWLATLMSNPRRRRTVIMCITVLFILISQAPNFYFNVLQHPGQSGFAKSRQQSDLAGKRMFEEFVAAERFVPPLWLPLGAQKLAEGNAVPALLGMLGCIGIGGLGLRRAYRSTIRFYHGDNGGKAEKRAIEMTVAKPAAKSGRPRNRAGVGMVEWTPPLVPEQAGALALATFRSLLRAPEVKMAWASSFISLAVVGGMIFLRTTPHLTENARPFVATGVVVFSTFMLVQFFANQFGFDRDGFRTLILSPAERQLVLLGKNLAVLPVGGIFGTFLLTLVSIWLRIPPVTFLATLFQLAFVLLVAGIGGNLVSILVPYRIQPGSMKPTKMPGLAMLTMLFCHLLFPTAMAPIFLAPLFGMLWKTANWPAVVPVNLIASALFCAAAALIYWQTLEPLGRLLQRREPKILSVVTTEVE